MLKSRCFVTADIFRGFMVSLYLMGKEKGHVQAYSPNGPTHFGEKPVHDENRHRVKLRLRA